jgi:hypothetical protein
MARNTPSCVLHSWKPPSGVGTFTATISPPRVFQVDLLTCLHRFLLASFCRIPVVLAAQLASPLSLAVLHNPCRNLRRKCGPFLARAIRFCRQTKIRLEFIPGNLSWVLHSPVSTLLKQISRISCFSGEVSLYPHQEPLLMQPNSCIWGPFNVCHLLLMTVLLGGPSRFYSSVTGPSMGQCYCSPNPQSIVS